MTKKELDKKLWQIEVDLVNDVYKNGIDWYTPDPITVIINDTAYEIELESCKYSENILVPTIDTPHEITEVNWMDYSDGDYHYYVKFDDFCKNFNIK